MKVMKLAEISEQDENMKSQLDEMMDELYAENPYSMAVTYYKDFKKLLLKRQNQSLFPLLSGYKRSICRKSETLPLRIISTLIPSAIRKQRCS